MIYAMILLPFALVLGIFPFLWPFEVWVWRHLQGGEAHARRLFEAGFLGFTAGGVVFLALALAAPVPRPDLVLAEAVPDLLPAAGAGVATFWVVWLGSRLSWWVRSGEPVASSPPRLLSLGALFLATVAVWWVRRTPPEPGFSGWFAQ